MEKVNTAFIELNLRLHLSPKSRLLFPFVIKWVQNYRQVQTFPNSMVFIINLIMIFAKLRESKIVWKSSGKMCRIMLNNVQLF